MDTVREFARKIDSGRKIPWRTGKSNLPRRRAGPTLYQLSYIPSPVVRQGDQTYSCYRGRQILTSLSDSVLCLMRIVLTRFLSGSTRGCSSVGRVSDRHAAEAGSIPRCGKEFFSQSRLSVQTLLPCPHSPRVQSHALTSVCELKFPSIGSHTFVRTHDNTAFTVSNG